MSRKQQAAYKTRRSRSHDNNVYQLQEALVSNGHAYSEGPKRKTWTRHDLKNVRPLTPNQAEMFRAFFDGQHLCVHGTAGTGKSYVALYLALTEVLKQGSDIDKIIIVRSAVPTRELGHLPGTIEEKTAVYEMPYADMFTEFCGRSSTYADMKEAGVVHFMTTSYVRGITWDNAIVVVDEGQNMTGHEINSIMTRLGKNSRILFLGDLPQTDLRNKRNEVTGMDTLIEIASRMNEFSTIQFTHDDIVRSSFVRKWIIASEGKFS